MKNLVFVVTVLSAQLVLAKLNSSDFNSLIQQQSQSQNETHHALSATIEEKLPADNNRIVVTNRQVSLEIYNKKSSGKKARISSNERFEEEDFSRLDREIGNGH